MNKAFSGSAMLVLLATCAVWAAEVPDAPRATDWPAFHGGGVRTGESKVALGPPPMKTRWTYQTDEDDPAPVLGSAAIVGDTAYVADVEGILHAINLKTGKARWTYAADDGF